MLRYDKYLDNAFWEAGYGAAWRRLWLLCPKEEIMNITPFANTQDEVGENEISHLVDDRCSGPSLFWHLEAGCSRELVGSPAFWPSC